MTGPETSRSVPTIADRRWAWARFALLVAALVALLVVGEVRGWPGESALRARVDSAGAWGAAVFVLGYAVLALLPAPKGVLTALGGALYGVGLGALLSWTGALIGAALAFWLGRLMGRDAVNRLLNGRLDRADAALAEHGFLAVVAVRLVPVLPFTAVNYAAGLTGVRFAPYLLGSAIGMAPGSLAYAALGGAGTSPWGVLLGLTGLVVVGLVGSLLGRRLLPGSGDAKRSSPNPDGTSTKEVD